MASTSTSNQTISSFQCPITFDFDPRNITDLPPAVIPTWISLAVFNAVTSPLTVLINLLVIWTVMEKEQLRSNSYFLLLSVLSFSDLLVGLVVQLMFVGLLVCIMLECTLVCEFAMAYGVPGLLCSAWTAVTMAIISLERYLYIEHAMHYNTLVSTKKLMTTTTLSWVLVGTGVLTSRLVLNNSFWAKQLPLTLTFGPSAIIIFFCVAKINLTARRQIRAIAALQQPAAKQSKIKEYKRTFALGLIVLASVACLCPLLVLKLIGAVNGYWIGNIGFLNGTAFTFIHLQSLVNPIIYSFRLSDIRSGMAKKLGCNCQ